MKSVAPCLRFVFPLFPVEHNIGVIQFGTAVIPRDQRVFEPVLIVSLLVVLAPVCPPELCPSKRPECESFRDIEKIARLNRMNEICVKCSRGIAYADLLVLLSALTKVL